MFDKGEINKLIRMLCLIYIASNITFQTRKLSKTKHKHKGILKK